MYRGGSWIYEKSFGTHSTKRWWWSHRKRKQFDRSVECGSQRDGVLKACQKQAAGPRGSRTCVCAITLAHAGREGRINVLPWYRLVGVTSTSSEAQEGKTRLPPRVRGRHVVLGWQSSPIPECARVTGKAGENGQYWGNGAASQPGRDRRLLGPVTHPRPRRAPARSEVETQEAWLRGRYRLVHPPVVLSRRSETAQCTVSLTWGLGAGKPRKRFERSRPWSWALRRCCGKRMCLLK